MPKLNPAVGTDAELKRAFPKAITPPQLLFDFANWYRDQPAGSIGGIELFDRDAEELMPPRATCRDDFALFINMPDGGAAGLWLKDDQNPNTAPMVLLSSEGEFVTLAPNFACFLFRLSMQQFDEDTFEADFLPYEDDVDRTDALGDWLIKHPDAAQPIADQNRHDFSNYDDGKAAKWLEAYLQELHEALLSDPDTRAISGALSAHGYRPTADEFGFVVAYFRAFAAGSTMIIKQGPAVIVTKGVNDLDDIAPDLHDQLAPPLFNLRLKHAKARKGNGLWPSCTFTIDNTGVVEIDPNYHHEFAIGLDHFTAAEFAVDQNTHPRTPSKIQPWQQAQIDTGGR